MLVLLIMHDMTVHYTSVYQGPIPDSTIFVAVSGGNKVNLKKKNNNKNKCGIRMLFDDVTHFFLNSYDSQ